MTAQHPHDDTTPAPATETPHTPAAATAAHEPRNFLVTFLLASFGGYLGLRHFYLGEPRLGWIRSGLFAGGYAVMLLGMVFDLSLAMFVGSLGVMVAGVWAIVDYFYVFFAVKNDAEGQPLVATARDKRWATVMFWVIIALSVIFVLLYILLIVVALANPELFQAQPSADTPFSPDDSYFPMRGDVY